MKKLISLLLIILLCTSLFACGSSSSDESEITSPIYYFYADSSGNSKSFELDQEAKLHPYHLELLTNEDTVVTYEGDENYTIRKGVDVSKWQGYVDWEKVKADGYDFAFMRLGYRGYEEGLLHVDTTFHQNMQNAGEAGLDLGVYFFSQALTEEEAIEEANFVLEALQDYQLQLPIVYDPEFVYEENSRTKDLTGEQITKNSIAFCETIRAAGYNPMIYSNMYWEAELFDMSQLQDYPFWYADYTEKPQTPYDFSFWQYSDTGKVDGIEGNADLNIQFIPVKEAEK